MEWAARVIKSHPAERRLVKEFVEWLLATKKYSPEVKSYECTTGWPTCDLYYPKRNILIEAKATVDRGAIRMAIGQLFDYSYLHVRGDGTLRPPKLGLLVPQKVDDDLGGLLKSLDITVIWKEGAEFRDSVKGRFFT
jgi:5-methylcytosine-specific restriction protein A